MSFKAVLFDWDGTVLDSMPAEYRGCVAVFEAAGLEPPSMAYFCQKLTMPFYDWFLRHDVNMQEEHLQKVYHAAVDRKDARLFPGARDCFQLLRRAGLKLGIVSARKWPELLSALEKHSMMQYLEVATGDAEDKAMAIMKACDEIGVSPKQAMYVGDLATDVHAGKRAGVATVGFLGAYGDRATFSDIKPDHIAASHEDLWELILGLIKTEPLSASPLN